MYSEKFNLHITTPEGEENDPELLRLRGELMAIKPLLDDAIKRQSVSEAEEIFEKAKEAKAKLEAYKESLNKKEQYSTIEINGTTIELGPILNPMKWDEIPGKLEEFNKTLKPGEKPWRLPTKEEFEEIGKDIRDIMDDRFLTGKEKQQKAKEIAESFRFVWDSYYWLNKSLDGVNNDHAWCWCSYDGYLSNNRKIHDNLVRLVR